MTQSPSSLGDRLYQSFYDFVRKTPGLNHLAHRVMQSERVHHIPAYRKLYESLIERKSAQYLHTPPFLELTITDACNARCIMCPPDVHAGSTFMDQALFERLVREAEEIGIQKMVITGGEPLLDKHIFDKIRYAKAHGFTYIHMFTNGSLMTEAKAKELIETGLDSITWSIDSVRKEEYEKIRINLNFDRTITNIQRFMEIRQELGKETPLTRVNMVCLPENQTSRQEFREFFGKFVDIVEIIDSHNWSGRQEDLNDGAGHEYDQKVRHPCHLLFAKVVVRPDGVVMKCSIEHGSNAEVGNLNQQSLQDVLNSPKLMALKQQHLNYQFTQPGCDVCTHKESWWVNY